MASQMSNTATKSKHKSFIMKETDPILDAKAREAILGDRLALSFGFGNGQLAFLARLFGR